VDTTAPARRAPGGRHRKPGPARQAGRIGGGVAGAARTAGLVVALAGALLLVLAHGLGWSAMIVRSGSMEPGVPVGSLVLARPESGSDVRVGQAIAVQRTGTGKPVTVLHRVIAISERDGVRFAELKGDANPTPDPHPVALTRYVALPVLVVPNLGYAVSSVRAFAPPSRLLLVVVGAVGLWLIWGRGRPRRRAVA
jgi:signal peptidase